MNEQEEDRELETMKILSKMGTQIGEMEKMETVTMKWIGIEKRITNNIRETMYKEDKMKEIPNKNPMKISRINININTLWD